MNRILQYVTKKNLIVATFILLANFLLLNSLHHPLSILTIKELSGGHTILNLLPFYGATTGYEYLESYPSDAVSIYKRILLFDLIILIPSYVFFCFMGLGYYGKKIMTEKNTILSNVLLLPIIAALLNIVENVIIYYLLNYLPIHLSS